MIEPSWQPVLHPGSHYEPLGTGLKTGQQGSTPGTAPLQITLRITGVVPTRARSGWSVRDWLAPSSQAGDSVTDELGGDDLAQDGDDRGVVLAHPVFQPGEQFL